MIFLQVDSEVSGIRVTGIKPSADDGFAIEFNAPVGVTDLNAGGVTFSLDGTEIEASGLTSATADDFTVALVIDVSDSMQGEALASAKSAAADFLDELPEQVPVSLVAFGAEAELIAPATRDRESIAEAIDRLEVRGETALYDGVTLALDSSTSPTQRSAIVVLSDGGDTVSKTDLAQVTSQLRESNSQIIAISLETSESSSETLDTLVGNRGEVVRVDDTASLDQAYTSVAASLSTEYSAKFNQPLSSEGADFVITIANSSGTDYIWGDTITADTPDVLAAVAEQPAPVTIASAPAGGVLNSPAALWLGAALCVAAVFALLVNFATRPREVQASVGARDFSKLSTTSKVDVFNDLRMDASRAIELSLIHI